jgi:hypothetical protein
MASRNDDPHVGSLAECCAVGREDAPAAGILAGRRGRDHLDRNVDRLARRHGLGQADRRAAHRFAIDQPELISRIPGTRAVIEKAPCLFERCARRKVRVIGNGDIRQKLRVVDARLWRRGRISAWRSRRLSARRLRRLWCNWLRRDVPCGCRRQDRFGRLRKFRCAVAGRCRRAAAAARNDDRGDEEECDDEPYSTGHDDPLLKNDE